MNAVDIRLSKPNTCDDRPSPCLLGYRPFMA